MKREVDAMIVEYNRIGAQMSSKTVVKRLPRICNLLRAADAKRSHLYKGYFFKLWKSRCSYGMCRGDKTFQEFLSVFRMMRDMRMDDTTETSNELVSDVMTQETSQIGDPRRAAEVAKEGKAIFSNQKLKSFASIEIPYVATYVDLSNNKLTNFNGFEPTSKLQTLIVDNNPLLTFQGFPANQMILHFSAKNTPISDLKIFRSLVLLTIGNQLETINGIPVTANERKEISGKALTEHFLRRNIVKLSKKQKNAVATQLADCLRRGYICDSWPAKMSIIQTATDRQENDPITVRVMRLVKMLGKDESLTDQIMEWIFAPKLSSEVVQTSQIVDERLTKQQMLINYMAEQLEELKKANASNMNRTGIRTATSAKQATKREPKVSEETRSAYQQMLSEVGVPLIENSHRCEIEERKEAEKDYEGLRKAALRLLRETDDVSDAEIAARLREQIA